MTMINWNEVITSRVLPAGIYNLRIASADLGHNTYSGLLQITLELRVDAPDVAKGKAHYEFLELGKGPYTTIKEEWSEDFKEFAQINDPNFEDPRVQQRSRELKTFKRMLECAGMQLPAQASLEDVCRMAEGKVFTGHISVGVYEYSKRAGEEKNILDAIFPFGSETPGIDTAKTAKPSTVPKTSTPARPKPNMSAQPVAPATPVDFFNDEDED